MDELKVLESSVGGVEARESRELDDMDEDSVGTGSEGSVG